MALVKIKQIRVHGEVRGAVFSGGFRRPAWPSLVPGYENTEKNRLLCGKEGRCGVRVAYVGGGGC